VDNDNVLAECPYVLMGSVTRPHGIKGELKVRPFTADPENFVHYPRLFLSRDASGPKIECTNRQARVSGNQVILRLQECSTREGAEALVGQLIWLAIEDLPPLSTGEFYLHTLLGKCIQTADGQILGQAENFLSGSDQEILVVRQGQQEYLIPVVQAFIHSIDATTVVLDVPEGLLDING
jgi:16S rRNA processing protein RimM